MAIRNRYPHPPCPKCGASGGESSKIYNTFYTSNEEIVRQRLCKHCGFKWFTYQEPEMTLLASDYQISFPPRFERSKQVVLKRL